MDMEDIAKLVGEAHDKAYKQGQEDLLNEMIDACFMDMEPSHIWSQVRRQFIYKVAREKSITLKHNT
jgi:hypothetical protein